MRFANEEALRVFILLIPVFLFFAFKTVVILRNLRGFMDERTSRKLFFPVSRVSVAVKFALLTAAFVLFTIALARPLGNPVRKDVTYRGIDIMIALDVSSSMAAIDLEPNRMALVKKGVKNFLYTLAGDRAGLIVFAGVDFIQCPLTIDYEAMELITDNVFPGMLFKDGTALGNAVNASVKRLELKGGKSKIIILITDGENTAGGDPIKAARKAKEKGIRVYTIGVGTKQGGRIPTGRDAFGRPRFKTYRGRVVVSKLDDSQLKRVAKITGGKYYRVQDKGAFKDIYSDIKDMEENKADIKKNVKYEENYRGWLLAGLILFVLSNIIPVRKPVLKRRG